MACTKAAQAAPQGKGVEGMGVGGEDEVEAVDAGTKVILDEVSGYYRPGQLLAIMGSSGAGKTSLLNLLAGRFSHYGGEVLLNGRSATTALRQHSAFVQQQDLFFRELTVHEHLTFQAQMREPFGRSSCATSASSRCSSSSTCSKLQWPHITSRTERSRLGSPCSPLMGHQHLWRSL